MTDGHCQGPFNRKLDTNTQKILYIAENENTGNEFHNK